ncbi:unnamed protein product [Ceutorhynchus assimilis]|uniref:Uncharacterized protein n=1 Tax=Ceutorhynchus assimilis TaxID=467358 RepID=A0A9N9QJY9_9CUCU|nr:unnamed protein product [Ceutorhynchus assimilis]
MRLFIVSTARDLGLREFFKYENQKYPPALSLHGEIRPGNKSDLLSILEKHTSLSEHPMQCQGLIIDGAGLVHLYKPTGTFTNVSEYCSKQLGPILTKIANSVDAFRIDVAWDLYCNMSLKATTRDRRGAGVRQIDIPEKGSAWSAWKDPEITAAFKCLSFPPSIDKLTDAHLKALEKFTIDMYDSRSEITDINEARRNLFVTGEKSISVIPPTAAALLEHIKRAKYQAGEIWGRALEGSISSRPFPEQWGWKRREDGSLEPVWSHLSSELISKSESYIEVAQQSSTKFSKYLEHKETRLSGTDRGFIELPRFSYININPETIKIKTQA